MRHSPVDFHETKPLNKLIIDGQSVDDHHIFRQKFLAKRVKSARSTVS
jgi:hypothetical protein